MAHKKEPWWQQHIPLIYPQMYLDIARERGGDLTAIINHAGLGSRVLSNASPQLTFLQFNRLTQAVLAAVGDNGLGIEVGLRLPPTAFGNVGYALLCSEKVEMALQLCLRFWHLLGRGMSLTFVPGSTISTLDLTPVMPFPEPIHHLSIEATLASFHRGLQLLAKPAVDDVEIWFSMPAPKYADFVVSRLGHVRYDMPANQLRVASHLMQQKLPMHNPTGLNFAIQQCEREESMLTDAGYKIRERVRQEITFGPKGYPSLEEMGQRLNMAPRTLRRHLEQEGTSFRALVDEAKRRDAVMLLDDSKLPILHIASLLGYREQANFTRSFRQWTGQSPSEYRLTRRASK